MGKHKIAEIQKSPKTSSLAGKYLTFLLGQEEYGIGILKIKEIIGMMPIITLPQTPSFIKGVINLRGKVIPIMDLRLKFGLETTDHSDRTCIVVVEIERGSRLLTMGLVVDAVSEVANFRRGEIEEAPDCGAGIHAGYVQGDGQNSRGSQDSSGY